jgi:hypothetical protein
VKVRERGRQATDLASESQLIQALARRSNHELAHLHILFIYLFFYDPELVHLHILFRVYT